MLQAACHQPLQVTEDMASSMVYRILQRQHVHETQDPISIIVL